MDSKTIFYTDCWYKVLYSNLTNTSFSFTAIKIEVLDEENHSNCGLSDSEIKGTLGWDGYATIQSMDNITFGGIWEFEQFQQLIKHIYKFGYDKGILLDVD